MTVSKTDGYTGTAKWLHWGMALIWLGSWGVGILATQPACLTCRQWLRPIPISMIWPSSSIPERRGFAARSSAGMCWWRSSTT